MQKNNHEGHLTAQIIVYNISIGIKGLKEYGADNNFTLKRSKK
jgi:hypothetical protein